LIADEDFSSQDWENDAGTPPPETAFTWSTFSGNAYAAILGLIGTGLLGTYTNFSGTDEWMEIRGPTLSFGEEEDRWNTPVLSIIPPLNQASAPPQLDPLLFKNGLVLHNHGGKSIEGAQPFEVCWEGILLVKRAGDYHFFAGQPSPKHRKPVHREKLPVRWLVTLGRRQKTWVLLNKCWPHEEEEAPEHDSHGVCLNRGAYRVSIKFKQDVCYHEDHEDRHCGPETGFELKYKGPDTQDCIEVLHHRKLIEKWKTRPLAKYEGETDLFSPVSSGLPAVASAANFLRLQYYSTLRDIRRTYERAFKAILFSHRFHLKAWEIECDHESELGYMLDHPDRFQGTTYYQATGSLVWHTHHVNFDFNFLPVEDSLAPPTGSPPDSRANPSSKRQAALFDQWERTFDYAQLRARVRRCHEHPVWLMFEEVDRQQPTQLERPLRYLGVELTLADAILTYFDTPVYSVTTADLLDERWANRIWHANKWIEEIEDTFSSDTLGKTHPAIWASDDPNAVIGSSTGDQDLVQFVQQSLIREPHPDIDRLKHLNDGLRLRAREALLAYLCQMQRIELPFYSPPQFAQTPRDLSDLLLQDVETGLELRNSRIDDAIQATVSFVQRAKLGLEPLWTATFPFEKIWNCRLSTMELWQAWKRRQVYGENWLQWEEIKNLEKHEGSKLLLEELRKKAVNIAEPGRSLWWSPAGNQLPCEVDLTQSRELVALSVQNHSLFEGLSVLGTPMRDARPTLLAPIPLPSTSSPAGPPITTPIPKVTPLAAGGAPTLDPGLSALQNLPLWVSAAVRLGARFVRVAAAYKPPGIPYLPKEDEIECRCKCGGDNHTLMDEYYFWLQDARYFRFKDAGGAVSDPIGSGYVQNSDLGAQSNVDPQTDWYTVDVDDPTKMPGLLKWPDRPMVYLFWTRVHMGTLDPPRRSSGGLPVDPKATDLPDLEYMGRSLDTLTFNVLNTLPPAKAQGGTGSGSGSANELGGFEYKIIPDMAFPIELQDPPATTPTPPTPPTPPLAAYPWFIYFEPGKPLEPMSPVGIAMATADMLRSNCEYDCATLWYRSVFDPTARDNTWSQCKKTRQSSEDPSTTDANEIEALAVTSGLGSGQPGGADAAQHVDREHNVSASKGHRDPPCCPCIAKGGVARARAVLLNYLETLIRWVDSLLCRNSAEAYHEARVILDLAARILGPEPKTIKAHDVIAPPMIVGSFVASPPPLNPRLMELYDEVTDRHRLIENDDNGRRLRNARDVALWGSHRRYDNALQFAKNTNGPEKMCLGTECASCCQPYRFTVVIEKASEWASRLISLGSSLQAAFEKGDSEYFSALRQTQERQLADLGEDISKNSWRAADWDVQALDQTMEGALHRLRYYQGLINGGLNANESAYVVAVTASMASRAAAQISKSTAGGEIQVPDMYEGAAGIFGTPVNVLLIPGSGSKDAYTSSSTGDVLNTLAEESSSQSGLFNTEGGWDRRLAEWQHEVDIITVEIQQIKRQQLASWRRRDNALRELNNQRVLMEHAAEVQSFLRDKFTKHELYLYLQQETLALYVQTYRMAIKVARQAQEAFWYERADARREFLNEITWDSLHEGFLVGEKLDHALRNMNQAYMDLNCRELELTKQFSLRQQFAKEFRLLKSTGYCEVEIPEWMFDLDYPGLYLRRIKSITLTIPCVAGPYTGIHCRLQLLKSSIRYTPLIPSPEECCCERKVKKEDPHCCNKGKDKVHCHHCYKHKKVCPERECKCKKCCMEDPYLVTRYSATEAIATSGGVDDSGLFRLDFADERYLPFEFSGAVSRWRIELPPENNGFDFDSISDLVIKMNYTAREGGDALRRLVRERVACKLPDDGVRFIDVRHDMPDVWRAFQACRPDDWDDECRRDHEEFEIPVSLSRNKFPFLTGRRAVQVKSVHIFIEKDGSEHEWPDGDHFKIGWRTPGPDHCCCDDKHKRGIICRSGTDDCVYYGCFDLCVPLLRGHKPVRIGKLALPKRLGGVRAVYLLFEYCAERVDRCKCKRDCNDC
jgi:hypothetical protein